VAVLLTAPPSQRLALFRLAAFDAGRHQPQGTIGTGGQGVMTMLVQTPESAPCPKLAPLGCGAGGARHKSNCLTFDGHAAAFSCRQQFGYLIVLVW